MSDRNFNHTRQEEEAEEKAEEPPEDEARTKTESGQQKGHLNLPAPVAGCLRSGDWKMKHDWTVLIVMST